jgi:hypothetical protein
MDLDAAGFARLRVPRPDYIVASLQFVLHQAESLTRQTPKPVAIHGTGPCVPACNNPQARTALARHGMQTHTANIGGPTAGEH